MDTLVKNIKEALYVENIIIALEKKIAQEDRRMKNVSFKDEPKKKTLKVPFDPEGLQKVLKTMSSKMVEIKKQVVDSSYNKPFISFKRNHTSNH